MSLMPDADDLMGGTSTPDGYARHLRQIRERRHTSQEAVAADLADMNAQALRNATLLEQSARFLETVAGSEMPMNALDVEIQPMAAIAAMLAEWFDELAVALKDEHDRIVEEAVD